MEPILCKIRSNQDIKGVEIANKQYKIAAYADNVLLFLTDPISTLPNLLKDFSLFKELSNLQINFTKFKALNVSLPDSTVTLCKTNFPFGWDTHAIQKDRKTSRNGTDVLFCTFLWFGRVAIVKMNILPRILYLLQTIPIKLPPIFFFTYKRLCLNFLWAAKQARIRWGKWVTPKWKGGIGLPDIQKYYWSCHLARIIDWHLHSKTKAWINVEEAFSSLAIRQLPCINPLKSPQENR